MEPGYPDLAGYDFFEARLYLTKLWLIGGEGPAAAEAECILASPCKYRDVSHPLQQLLNSKDFERPERILTHRLERQQVTDDVFVLSSLPKRGWNHGKDVDAMLEEVLSRRPDSLGRDLANWALERVPIDRFQIPANADTFRRWPSYEFRLEREFKLNAEMVAVEWVASNFGDANPTKLHILNFDLN